MKADSEFSGRKQSAIYCNVYHTFGQIFSVTTYDLDISLFLFTVIPLHTTALLSDSVPSRPPPLNEILAQRFTTHKCCMLLLARNQTQLNCTGPFIWLLPLYFGAHELHNTYSGVVILEMSDQHCRLGSSRATQKLMEGMMVKSRNIQKERCAHACALSSNFIM